MSHKKAQKAREVFCVLCAFLWLVFPRVEPLRFEVTTNFGPASGRLFIIISSSNPPEPRLRVGETGMEAAPILGRDVQNFGPGVVAAIDRTAAIFPLSNLDALPSGDYYVQALFDSNVDLGSVNAPGNQYSDVQRVHLNPRAGGIVRLSLTKSIPAEQLPSNDQYLRYVKIQSTLLTRFHKRPIYLRAGVILPKDYSAENRRWPLRIHIGGYGTRYTSVQRLMAAGSEFRRMWLADDTPRFIYVQLDGDGPYGDPYQVNSDNNGPYGDAITHELIPYIEKDFHGLGAPHARVLDGESTGGWVSLALKIFYPDFFNAVWSSCPDGVDFRGFQIIDIYKDRNAYFDERGAERPSKRNIDGRVEFSIRHECQMENVLGAGDSWTMSGQQWGAWNATYGPRGSDGRPVSLWDAKTGVINKAVVDHWRKYDLRLILQQNWKTLGPKLRGKIHISVGEADDYYLNNAVHLLDDFLKEVDPPAEARITYGPGRGHCWSNVSEAEKMKEMAVAVERANPGLPRWEEQKSGTAARLRGVSAVDENVVWASGTDGTVVKTVDGGLHWQASVVP
jgi:S-formylglutathione hydrolase FrmB